MCSTIAITEGVTRTGFRRGSHQLVVKNPGSLGKKRFVESKPFQIGGFKWKLAIFRDCQFFAPLGTIKISLLSCNDVSVSADVNLTVSTDQKAELPFVERKKKIACPFNSMERQNIPLNRFVESKETSQLTDTMMVTADLKNVRVATDAEGRSVKINSRTVHLEVIDDTSINKALNGGTKLAIVPAEYARNSDVWSRSFVHLWDQQHPDFRHWLCKRRRDGSVVMTRCLKNIAPLTCFEDICDDDRGGAPWVSVFREKKKSNEEFQPVDDGTVVIFCMLQDSSYEDFTYLGHLFVQGTTSCRDFTEQVVSDMAQLEDDQCYNVFRTEGGNCTEEITHKLSSLKECGVQSGSIVVVRPTVEDNEEMLDEEPESEELPETLGFKDELECIHEQKASDDMDSHYSRQEISNEVSEEHSEIASSDRANNGFEISSSDMESRTTEYHCRSDSIPDNQTEVGDDTQSRSDNTNILDGFIQSQSDTDSEEIDTAFSEHFSSSSTILAHPTVLGRAEDVMGPVDESVNGCDVREVAMKIVRQAITDIDIRTELKNRVQEPIIKEIRQVERDVRDVESTVTATHEEICKANLLADIQMEQLTENDSYLPLLERNGHEAFLMADDFVKDEPIFLLDHRKDYRMRIRLLLKHQRDASNFKIKYVSVKPSDGLELGLKIETRQPCKSNEAIALFQFDKFQSVRLSSASPQFGAIHEKYISLPITIGVETASHKLSSRRSGFEVNGRILCRLSAGIDCMNIRRFERFALQGWKNAPQWIRDEAKGVVFVASMAIDGSTRPGPWRYFQTWFQ